MPPTMKYILPALLVMYITCAQAQQALDSLMKIVPELKGQQKVNAYNGIAHYYTAHDYKRSIEYINKARDLAKKIDYKRGFLLSKVIESIAESSAGNKATAINLLTEVDLESKLARENGIRGYALTCLGQGFLIEGKADSAFYYFNQALPLLDGTQEPYYLSFLYLSFGDYYKFRQDPDQQFTYLEKAWNIRLKVPDKSYLPQAGRRMAELLTDLGDFPKALQYLETSRQALGKDTVDTEEISILLQQRASILARMGQYPEAVKLFYKVRIFYNNPGYTHELTNLLLESSTIFDDLGDYELSMKQSLEALALAEKHNYELEKCKAYINLAWTYNALDQHDQAKNYIHLALDKAIELKLPAQEATAYNLIGLLKSYDGKTDSAFFYLEKALEIRTRLNDRKGVSNTLSNIGNIYEDSGDLQNALKYELKSLEIEEILQRPYGLTYSYVVLGRLYIELNDLSKAELYLNKAEILAKRLKVASKLIDTYRIKRDLYFKQNKVAEAHKYMVLHEALRDSVFSSDLANQLSLQRSLYDVNRRDLEISKQKEILRLQETHIREQGNILWTISGCLIILGLMSILLLINNRKIKSLNAEVHKQNRMLLENQEEISAQNEELTQSNDEILMQRDQLADQNKKLDIAREIIESQNKKITTHNERLQEEVDARTKELVEYVRQLEQFTFISSHNLRAPVARILGLGNLLEMGGMEAKDLQQIHHGLIQNAFELDRVVRDLNVILEVKKNLNKDFTQVIFEKEWELVHMNLINEIEGRHAAIKVDFSKAPELKSVAPYVQSILLNLVSNAIKYSKPGMPPEIEINSTYKENFLCLTVKDYGLGLDLNQYGDKLFTLYKRFHDHVDGKGLGLYLIKTQIESLGGKIEVKSAVNIGTTFEVYFPTSEIVVPA